MKSGFIYQSLQFVLQTSQFYKIDDSHNLKHSLDVLKQGKLLMDNQLRHYNTESKSIIYLGCILHDMCDRKYMDVENGLTNIANFLKTTKVNQNVIDSVMKILPRMSYSKTVENNQFQLPKDMYDFPYLEEYHIIRHADLLTSYKLFRTIEMRYQECIRNNKTVDMDRIVEEADTIINKRIFALMGGNIFVEKEAKKLAKKYHHVAMRRYKNWKLQDTTNYKEIKAIL